MTRFADGPVVEVSVTVEATPEVVWNLVSDINLPARFQDEFRGAEWLDDPPALGSRFLGRNGIGDRTWETTSWISSYDPQRSFGWAVSDPDNPGATWTFRLEEVDGGTLLRYRRLLGPGPSGTKRRIDEDPDHEEEIIARRDATHRSNMQSVVDGIKELAESNAG